MKQQSKLRQGQEQETAAEAMAQNLSAAKEFSSVEEMLRFDAAQHPPPASLGSRLNESLPQGAGAAPWWVRLLRRFRNK